MSKKHIDLYSYAYGNAAGHYGTEEGPRAIREALGKQLAQFQQHAPLSVTGHKQQGNALVDVTQLSKTLAQRTMQSVLNNHFFITLGGDHSCAIGSWSGAATAIQNKGELGLIWFDAHMDSHTFQTTLSNNIHGMPLAILLGYGKPELTHILSDQPKLNPENVVLIGTRSFESDEAALLEKLNVKIFTMQDIAAAGLQAVMTQSLNIVTKNTHRFGISIDLDGFDPADAPGVGLREANGVSAADFLAEFSKITRHQNFIGMDIAEFNPALDQNHKTEKLIASLITCATRNFGFYPCT